MSNTNMGALLKLSIGGKAIMEKKIPLRDLHLVVDAIEGVEVGPTTAKAQAPSPPMKRPSNRGPHMTAELALEVMEYILAEYPDSDISEATGVRVGAIYQLRIGGSWTGLTGFEPWKLRDKRDLHKRSYFNRTKSGALNRRGKELVDKGSPRPGWNRKYAKARKAHK